MIISSIRFRRGIITRWLAFCGIRRFSEHANVSEMDRTSTTGISGRRARFADQESKLNTIAEQIAVLRKRIEELACEYRAGSGAWSG